MKQLDFIGQPTKEKSELEQYEFWHGPDALPLTANYPKQHPVRRSRNRRVWLATDYSKVDKLFNSFDAEEVERYKSYWESIKPKNDVETFQRWLFAFMSVHTTWERNVIGYEAIKDWTKWFNNTPLLKELLVNSRIGLHNNRARFVSEFSKRFWQDPEWFKYQGGSWQTFRDRLVKSILGLGIAKVSFSLEMIYPNEAEATCMDTHLFQAYGLDQTKDARRYVEIENYWLDMCRMWNVPSTIARAILWDRKQNQTDSRYWSYVLED